MQAFTRTSHPVLFSILGSFLLSLTQMAGYAQQVTAPVQPSMTVADVVKMVEVKLADDLIISQIRRNAKPFSLSADDIVRLKTAGASDNVIRVLLDPQAAVDAKSPAATTTLPPSLSLPSSYGYYILDGPKLSELRQVQVITRFGLTLADRGFAVDGLADQESLLKVEAQSPTIIVYQQNATPSTLEMRDLTFIGSMKAYQFNIVNTAPQFFSGLYRKDPNETVPIDLWRADHSIQLRVQPVEGKTDMYKLIPNTQLDVGKYVLYYPGAVHPSDTAFSASADRKSTALAFEIVRNTSSAPHATGEARPRPPGGTLYLVRGDKTIVTMKSEDAIIRRALGLFKAIDVTGVKASTRVGQKEQFYFLVKTPVMQWERISDYKVYKFSMTKDKRTTLLSDHTGFECNLTRSGGDFATLTILGRLSPGEYVFAPTNAQAPDIGATLAAITFGVD